MATYERQFQGNAEQVVQELEQAVLSGSASASAEGGTNAGIGDTRVYVRVFERYSMFGGNRVSLNLTVAGVGDHVLVSAITSGGSQAVMWKVNTVGEDAFLDTIIGAIDRLADQG